MIQLSSENLIATSTAHIQYVQNNINAESTFEAKVDSAKNYWATKESANVGKQAFSDIKGKLINMCSGIRICVYCEHNEATDVEHIFPKRLYPEKAFLWENYLLSCNRCNSHYKKDKCKVFNPRTSTTVLDITPVRNVFIPPPNDDILFINQRVENPMAFLELDFIAFTFQFTEIHDPGTREYEKAKFTKDILGLNTRADLVEQRKAAFIFFKAELAKYVAVSQSQTVLELEQCVDGIIDMVNGALVFQIEKDRIKQAIKQRILKHSHPTVWREMMRQRNVLPTTLALINQANEVLTW